MRGQSCDLWSDASSGTPKYSLVRTFAPPMIIYIRYQTYFPKVFIILLQCHTVPNYTGLSVEDYCIHNMCTQYFVHFCR